jgi:PAS domain-containing protein
MAEKPTYEELEQRIQEFEQAEFKRKRTEKALQESEERYRSLVELFPEAILVHQDWKIVYINPEGAKIFGAKDSEEIIGTS